MARRCSGEEGGDLVSRGVALGHNGAPGLAQWRGGSEKRGLHDSHSGSRTGEHDGQ
jgi:hypothetical protein